MNSIEMNPTSSADDPLDAQAPHRLNRMPSNLRVLFLGPASQEAAFHQNLVAEALCDLGCHATVAAGGPLARLDPVDVVVAYRPHGDPQVMESLLASSAANIPVVLDLDSDFCQMPPDHPDYEVFGLGDPTRAEAYATALHLADVVRVPNDALAMVLRSSGCRVRVIPDGWSQHNRLWEKPASARYTLNLGWVTGQGQLKDLYPLRRILLRVLREFSHVLLVILGDPRAYQLFDALPERQLLFLPAASQDDYPYLLGQVDLLALPLCNTSFNHTMSDLALVAAGIRELPWVASPVPAFISWNAGGLFANTLEDWHTALRQLILDPELRASLGAAGRLQAVCREMERLSCAWLALFEQTLAGFSKSYAS